MGYHFSDADFSPDRRYRFTLTRRWKEGGKDACFIGLNPSTADEVTNDPTVLRCMRRAHQMGYNGLRMVNIFAYRATDPNLLKAARAPVGQGNNLAILSEARKSGLVVCAWGTDGAFLDRGSTVETMLRDSGIRLHCLGMTKEGHPKHPLYLPYRQAAVPWRVG